jgi:hypothetical protein
MAVEKNKLASGAHATLSEEFRTVDPKAALNGFYETIRQFGPWSYRLSRSALALLL